MLECILQRFWGNGCTSGPGAQLVIIDCGFQVIPQEKIQHSIVCQITMVSYGLGLLGQPVYLSCLVICILVWWWVLLLKYYVLVFPTLLFKNMKKTCSLKQWITRICQRNSNLVFPLTSFRQQVLWKKNILMVLHMNFSLYFINIFQIKESNSRYFFMGQWNLHLRFLWEVVDLNTKLRKIVNGGNLTLRLLTWDFEIECQMRENLKSNNIKRGFHCIDVIEIKVIKNCQC
jgi:hypothetical protein